MLLVEAGSEPLSRFMQGLQQSYTQHFNRKRQKVGIYFRAVIRQSSVIRMSTC